jgi:TM2 domain-containing membrane protein YozV
LNPVCPYCRTEIGETEGEQTSCPGCSTPHHADCFAENGGCTVFGCSHAPVDEPKIQLSGSDLSATSAPETLAPLPQAAVAPALRSPVAPAPPPPPAADTTNAPPPPSPYAGERYFLQPTPAEEYASQQGPKSRVSFVLLGIFLGIFGAHNFYAGYMRKGAFQLCLTLFTCFYGAVISWIWALVEVCIVHKDFDDVQFT